MSNSELLDESKESIQTSITADYFRFLMEMRLPQSICRNVKLETRMKSHEEFFKSCEDGSFRAFQATWYDLCLAIVYGLTFREICMRNTSCGNV